MSRLWLERHALWFGFVAALVPLGVLLSLQYTWLVDLQQKSALAGNVYLENYLDAVAQKVEYFYRAEAERALNLPVSLLDRSDDKIARFFAKKKPAGTKLLFVADFRAESERWITAFDPVSELYGEPADVSMARAIYVALSPWKTLSHKGLPLQSPELVVEERDPDNRIVLHPLTDDGDRLLGIAGMVVDGSHFRATVLPEAVRESLPGCDGDPDDAYVVIARDGRGEIVYGAPRADAAGTTTRGRPGFVFTDWELSLVSYAPTPEEWAQSNFLVNVSLSALLAVSLLGGVVFALRTASREVRLSRMKSDFVSNVSHELRTPLASIRVFGEFLRLGRVAGDAKMREYGEYIETESRRLTQLVDNILDFSKIESGAKTYEFEPTDVEQVVADTLRMLEVGLRHNGIRLALDRPREPLPPLDVDAGAIAQALTNLVDNAAKYSTGGGEVRVGVDQVDGEVRIAVRDHGIGIEPDEQDKIFDRFHRVGTGLVHDVKGSGLGLSIVQHVVQAHGGRVSVASEPGAGSTFTIHLPVTDLPAETPDTVAAPHELSGHLPAEER